VAFLSCLLPGGCVARFVRLAAFWLSGGGNKTPIASP